MTDAAIAIARDLPADISAGDAGEWLEHQLATPASDRTRVVFHTIAWQYFPPAAQARALAAMEAASTPIVRFAMEADGGRGAKLTLTHYPSGEVQELGRADFHGRWVEWRASRGSAPRPSGGPRSIWAKKKGRTRIDLPGFR